MEEKSFIVEVEPSKPAKEGKPSIGPVYRSIFAKDGFPPPIPGLDSCWDIFRLSVEKYPENRMLGRREMVNGKPGKYSWMTYKEVYDIVLKVGNSIRSCGIEEGENKNFNLPTKRKTDICTIMYTSGTTGDPKGVMISNNSIVTLIAGVKHMLESVNEALTVNDVYLSYLPLAHIFDRVIEEFFINQGAAIGFWRGDVKLLVEDIVELQPSVFCAVPRVLDRIYSGLQQKISSGGLIKQTAFNFSYSLKLRNMRNGFKQSVASPICDKLVFNLVKQGLGGNVRLILSGAAPLASHVEEYLRVVTCSYVLQGYGLTETCAGTFVSIPDEMNMLGTVGPPLPNVDVCLESVPEMGYDALSRTPRGEVCVRGDTLFSGYYKREDLTKEVLIDGWFHTGDIGEWQPNGSLKIIDRKKNIFKLSQGEYVAVENLENIYSLVPDIESIWVYGNSFESFLVAIINPNKEAVEQWAKQNSISSDFNGLCENTEVKNYFLGELTRIAKEKKLKGFEFIKAIHLDPVPFDMEGDLITPTYKKKRPQLLKYYQDMIDSMYKNAK
ncbi:UNVERIFIED_CONTAM: Long chain acyl-CoA synthetase 4 [Sesamum angustifolium]|uniref:Long chain acyl-CoA synthetase 4 n=1 Tax=Sesamum angustifolium TaxID=2727405 RepID=A0AAW2J9Z3_9LAMI